MFTSQHRLLLTASVLLGTVLGLSSCYENTPAANPVSSSQQQSLIQLTATLNGAQIRPTAITSPGSGTFNAAIDRTTRVMSYTLAYSGISAVSAAINRNTQANTNGDRIVALTPLTSPIIGSITLRDQARVDSLSTGLCNVVVATSPNPAGEIRGDIRMR